MALSWTAGNAELGEVSEVSKGSALEVSPGLEDDSGLDGVVMSRGTGDSDHICGLGEDSGLEMSVELGEASNVKGQDELEDIL